MFLRINQIFFGSFLYAAQASMLVSVLYMICMSIAYFGLEGFVLAVGASVLAATFIGSFISFNLFMLLRNFHKKENVKVESWLVPIAPASMINAYFIFTVQETWKWQFVGFNLIVSVGAVWLSRWVYLRVIAKLVVMNSQTRSPV